MAGIGIGFHTPGGGGGSGSGSEMKSKAQTLNAGDNTLTHSEGAYLGFLQVFENLGKDPINIEWHNVSTSAANIVLPVGVTISNAVINYIKR